MKQLSEYIKESLNNEVNGFAILKPGCMDHEDDWYKMLQNNGWDIIQKRKFKMDLDIAKKLYGNKKDEDYYDDLCKYMASDDCICVMLHKNCNDPIDDLKKLKHKVRDNWGTDDMKNAMHSSDSIENVNREYKLIFENKDI